ncbi:hypothetical protein SAMN04487957_10596 [Halomonas shengliensis]|uniref:Uncharacterized protein n=1 Tax=Halomonas shengliensis TaxID=419597 RepID=A0A1H0IES4_9GAMM|nr:hypothetical protein [Halomonas shengliensis]SDO29989.1 hypothetical protein SAMN04487957_10596 [Halomonas shengliensis]
MAFPVKHFTSDMGGAPTLGDTAAGDFIGLLKACLVTGFNVTPIAGMTYDAGTGEVTVDVGTGHGFTKWQVVAISGADQAAYNGEHRVTAVTESSFSFVPEYAPATSPATGATLEAKAAPVGGWTIEAEDATNHKIALSRTAPDATDHVLLVENTGYSGDSGVNGNFANVRICESFTDFDTFDSVASYWWAASHRYASAEWLLVADGHLLYWIPRYATPGKRAAFVWGDIETVRPGDAAHCLVNGCDKSSTGEWDTSDSSYTAFAELGGSDYRGIARGHQQLPGEVPWQLYGIGTRLGDGVITYPNPATNGFYVATGKLMVVEQGSLRGFLPGLLQPLHTSSVYHGAVVDNLPDLEGVPVLFWLAMDSRSYAGTERLMAWRLDEWIPEVGA